MERQQRLRIAIQKSGRLTDHSLDLLARCGLKYSRGKDQLMCYGENMPLDVLFVRDDDIPDLVQEDVCDLGLVGLNVIEEKRLAMAARGAQARFELLQRLDFGRCRLSLAVPDDFPYAGLRDLAGQAHRDHLPARARALPAREFDRGRDRHAVGRGRDRAAARPRRPDLRPRLDRLHADARTTCARSTTVLESEAALIRTPVPLPDEKADWVRRLLLRIDGVQQVRESKYIMLHAPRSALPEIRACCPAASRRP